jgi:hypothetical protein
MTWMVILFLAGLAAGVGFMLFKRSNEARPAPSSVRTAPAGNPAHAVPGPVASAPNNRRYWGKQFIVLDPDEACPEARALHGKCFAYGKVPPVPLHGCAKSECTCHFRDLDERRSGEERRTGQERREDVRFEDKKDRRMGKDRRSGDHYDWRFTA